MALILDTRDNKTVSDQPWFNSVTYHIKQLWARLGTVLNNVIFPNTPYHGIRIDDGTGTETSDWGWVDLLGQIAADTATGNDKPSFEAYLGNLKQWRFAVGDAVYVEYHIPHDYVPNSDMFIHAHWSNLGGNVGDVEWQFEVSYSKGHNQMAFGSPITLTALEAASIVPSQHMVTEIPLSIAGGSVSNLNSADIEVDGLILVRVSLLSNTTGESPFLHYTDIHYQSTGIATKNRAPNFYA